MPPAANDGHHEPELMHIRTAIEADLPTIVQIYNAAIPGRMATADTAPVSVESRVAWFQRHTPQYPLWVAEQDSQILGWLGVQMFYGRPAYHATVEVSLYVDPMFHRQGVGRQLLHYAIAQSSTLGIQTLLGFVFAHNTPSLALLARFGFQRWGYLPGIAKLDGVQRDLIILGLSLPDPTGRSPQSVQQEYE
jgi:L-amino acid N-acyltransferase YncA